MRADERTRRADLAPGILQASVFVLGTGLYGYLAAQSGRPVLWALWGAIAACALSVSVEAMRFRAARRARARWLVAAGTAAFVLAVVFSAVRAAG